MFVPEHSQNRNGETLKQCLLYLELVLCSEIVGFLVRNTVTILMFA